MSTSAIDTVTTRADKAKLAASLALVGLGVFAFYLLGKQDLWLRVVALLVLLGAGVALFFTSVQGKELIGFAQDSGKELRKVVWPTRPEATQMTAYVFAFVVIMALFLWLTDKGLEWLLYSVILGWKA